MVDQESPSIIPLIEEQTDRTAFVEPQLELCSVLANDDWIGGRLSSHELGGHFGLPGLLRLARERLVVNSSHSLHPFHQSPLASRQGNLRLRKQPVSQPID